MKTRIKEILNSPKFWIATITMLFGVITYYYPIPEEVRTILFIWAGTVLGIGVVDSVANKIGGSTTVVQSVTGKKATKK